MFTFPIYNHNKPHLLYISYNNSPYTFHISPNIPNMNKRYQLCAVRTVRTICLNRSRNMIYNTNSNKFHKKLSYSLVYSFYRNRSTCYTDNITYYVSPWGNISNNKTSCKEYTLSDVSRNNISFF